MPKDEWVSLGPEEGEVIDKVVDPEVTTTLYAVTESAGMYKSVHGGEGWIAINDGFASTYVQALLMDPVSPCILYALTTLGGIYKSADGGESWNDIYSVPYDMFRPANPRLGLLAIDPTRPSILYAVTQYRDQVRKSTDGGKTWFTLNKSLILPNEDYVLNFLIVSQASPTTLFMGTEKALYKSMDGGVNWIEGGISGDMAFLIADPDSPAMQYAGRKDGGLYESMDGGMERNLVQGKGFHGHDMTTDSADRSTFYAVTGDPGDILQGTLTNMAVGVSEDMGRNWTTLFTPQGIEISTIAVDPDGADNLYTGTAAGVYMSINGGRDWKACNSGLSAYSIFNIAVDPKNPSTIYATESDYWG
jgi:photosystem II stability/assembly factor-like uncharacterized protein